MTVYENSLRTRGIDNHWRENWDEMRRRGSAPVQSEPLAPGLQPTGPVGARFPPEEGGVRAPRWALQPWGPALGRGDPHGMRLRNQQGLHLRALEGYGKQTPFLKGLCTNSLVLNSSARGSLTNTWITQGYSLTDFRSCVSWVWCFRSWCWVCWWAPLLSVEQNSPEINSCSYDQLIYEPRIQHYIVEKWHSLQ